MLAQYVEKTNTDRVFYERYLQYRMPSRMFDAHQHLILEEFTRDIPPEIIANDWSAQCYKEMSWEDSVAFARLLFPDTPFDMNALTVVDKGADISAANLYLANLKKRGMIRYAMMTVHPDWPAKEVERFYIENGFTGFKPYPDLVSGKKGSDIGIFEFLPDSFLEILNRYKGATTVHIPRSGRLADPRNVTELKSIRDRYPDVKLIVAHLGRCYSEDYMEKGLALLGDYARNMTFDLAAVLNPQVLEMAFEALNPEKILWGTDLPVFMWHGKRRWTRSEYFNLAREDFMWNAHEEGAKSEATYTFFLYEQVKNILDAIEARSGVRDTVEAVFWRNAMRLFDRANAHV